jgi:hypothetical protein
MDTRPYYQRRLPSPQDPTNFNAAISLALEQRVEIAESAVTKHTWTGRRGRTDVKARHSCCDC